MSKYTIQLRRICEVESGADEDLGYNSVDSIIANSINKIFGEFPIFDESYRTALEKKIVYHFYTREIAFETVGLFKLKLNTKMNEIMPFYNKLYETELLKFDPLTDTDIRTERDKSGSKVENRERNTKESGEGSVTSVENSKNVNDDWALYSDTPQGSLSNVKSGRYLTGAVNNTGEEKNETNGAGTSTSETEGNDKSNANISNIEDYFEHIKGKRGSKTYPELIKELRDSFLNIDMLIIDELETLFFQLW